MDEEKLVLKIDGMTCAGCAETVGRYLRRVDGVIDTAIDWRSGQGEVTFDAARTDEAAILESPAFRRQYRAEVVSHG